MKPADARWPIRIFRIATLVVPSALAWQVAFSALGDTRLADAVIYSLGPLWLLAAAAVLVRSVDAITRRGKAGAVRGSATSSNLDSPSLLDSLDLLTASGSAMAWLSAAAIIASVWIGWASLSVVGLFGAALLHLTIIWTCLRASGEDPWRRASVSRRFVPARLVAGDPVTEEVRFADVRIPVGFRLFVRGRVGPRWATSRYVLEHAQSQGEVLFESDVGPALRGEHAVEPLELWLQDIFGLCRSPRIRACANRLTVLPRPRTVDGSRRMLGQGGRDAEPQLTRRLPTEGALRLREYQPGDDARRIHWVRSLAARQMVVRLPDELPPHLPAVDLVLDTLTPPGSEALSCESPAALLDSLVAVWLGVGRALAESGVRVTLRTALPEAGGEVTPHRERLSLDAQAPSLALGSRVRWQAKLSVDALLGGKVPAIQSATSGSVIVVSWRLRQQASSRDSVRWIVLPQIWWASSGLEDARPHRSIALLPHPMGSPDNRWSRRRQERRRRERLAGDRLAFAIACADHLHPREGSFLARPKGPGYVQLEALA